MSVMRVIGSQQLLFVTDGMVKIILSGKKGFKGYFIG
jgi:hypothetical protein